MKNTEQQDFMELGANFYKTQEVVMSTKQRTINALYKAYKKGNLVLQDWFQRGYHWDHNKKVSLLHTLLNTPELLTGIVLFLDLDGKYYVADGQQRLTSIFKFMDGEYAYESPELSKAQFYYGVNKDHVLFEECVEKLEGESIYVTEIKNIGLDNKDKINILKSFVFLKWNNGSNLNPAELRGGLYSTVNDIVKPLIANLGTNRTEKEKDEIKRSLILSKEFGRNKINELFEKLIFHYIQSDLTKDPSPKQLKAIHCDAESTKKVQNSFQVIEKLLKTVCESTYEYKKQHKTYKVGHTSQRDIMIAAIKLKKNGKLNTMEDVKNYIIGMMKLLNDVYCVNKAFKAYKTFDFENTDAQVNTDWYQPYFNHFGRGQDSHVAKRVKFLMDIVDKVITVVERDKTRIFPQDMQVRVLVSQDNKCTVCGEELLMVDAEADHIVEHSKGGLTEESNCQMLHKDCHKNKTREFMTKQLEVVE
jgi:hypothetical protein